MLWIALHLPTLSLESFAATLGSLRHALPLALLQGQRIAAVNRVVPLKSMFMKEAAGQAGSLPRLMRGEAV